MDLRLIRPVLAAVESGAITEAAEQNGIAQLTPSRRIQQLGIIFVSHC
jgi:DNA-binding transcriptional LysR family regulator